MRIDAATSLFYGNHASRRDPDGNSFSETLLSAAANTSPAGPKQPSFTSMTRQEMRDWVNDRIRSGDMSLDESIPFMAMTMKMSHSGGTYIDVPAASDAERIDFMRRVRGGIEGALSRHDGATLDMLQSAMRIMQKHQAEAGGEEGPALTPIGTATLSRFTSGRG